MMRKGTILGQQGILRQKPRTKFKSPDMRFEFTYKSNNCLRCEKIIPFGCKYCSMFCRVKGPKPFKYDGPDLFA
jgi:hypothetical protein